MVTRDEKGRVVGGVLNPGGRPKEDAELRKRCRDIVDARVVARWEREVVEDGPNWVKCSELLAHYGYGKPKELHEVTGPNGQELYPQLTAEQLTQMYDVFSKGDK